MERKQQIIEQTRLWVENVVVKFGFCPFAKPVLQGERIHYRVVSTRNREQCLEALIHECVLLDTHPEVETSLIIFDGALHDFDEYLQFANVAEQLLIKQGYEGIYQLASFHPDYRFAGTGKNDPANYTNRSIMPMLHLLRESSIATALANYKEPEQIPERNIQYAREQGLVAMQSGLAACKIAKEDTDA